MFTGIIETLGLVRSMRTVPEGLKLEVEPSRRLARVRLGESIAVNGVCLTVTGLRSGRVTFDVIRQTLRVTNLGAVKSGDEVNLERALKYGDRLSGHYVLGHVESTAKILNIQKTAKETRITIALPKIIAPRVVLRGCIALDGISLTVSRRDPAAFCVHVIPHTWKHTNLKTRSAGDRVNLESDILFKIGRDQKRIGIPR